MPYHQERYRVDVVLEIGRVEAVERTSLLTDNENVLLEVSFELGLSTAEAATAGDFSRVVAVKTSVHSLWRFFLDDDRRARVCHIWFRMALNNDLSV